jgi:hypothetical protein
MPDAYTFSPFTGVPPGTGSPTSPMQAIVPSAQYPQRTGAIPYGNDQILPQMLLGTPGIVLPPGAAPAPVAQATMMPTQQPTMYQQPFAGDVVRQGIDPFLYGMPGFSPLMTAGLDAFGRGQQQVVQQQAELQGLGRSPAVGQMTSDALAQVLPQFIMEDYNNRFKAAGVLQGEEGLTQNAAQLAANIANQEQQRQLEAFNAGGNMLLGMGNLYNDLGQSQTQQMQLALQAAGAGGDIQQQIAQSALDAAQMERLRLQSMAEQSTTGLFSSLPGPAQLSGASTGSGGGK